MGRRHSCYHPSSNAVCTCIPRCSLTQNIRFRFRKQLRSSTRFFAAYIPPAVCSLWGEGRTVSSIVAIQEQYNRFFATCQRFFTKNGGKRLQPDGFCRFVPGTGKDGKSYFKVFIIFYFLIICNKIILYQFNLLIKLIDFFF